ncbi:hypothetical protein ACFYTQ_31645 [Nocardia sp. NPDC004068]|uniref:hypothetical protein n=1 Tax=Nocardia sp. NPDC004068 TaxID=3364303 RepID=UPI0036D04763
MSANRFRRTGSDVARRIEDEAIDAVTDVRARRRCHYDRAGLDAIMSAVHLWAETGHVPGWDAHLGDDGGDWAA